MGTAQIGIVYYQDDPDQKVFRRVMESYAGEFDDADCLAAVEAEQTTQGVDPTRTAVMEMVAPDDPRANVFTGTPDAPATTDGIDANGDRWPPVEDIISTGNQTSF